MSGIPAGETLLCGGRSELPGGKPVLWELLSGALAGERELLGGGFLLWELLSEGLVGPWSR
jgi:hypothetical protein